MEKGYDNTLAVPTSIEEEQQIYDRVTARIFNSRLESLRQKEPGSERIHNLENLLSQKLLITSPQ